MFTYVQSAHANRPAAELRRVLNAARNFLKHADPNRDQTEHVSLDDDMNANAIFLAAHDCAMLCESAQPPEVQAFNLWFLATRFPLDPQSSDVARDKALEIGNDIQAAYPGLRTAELVEQKRIGKIMVEESIRITAPPNVTDS